MFFFFFPRPVFYIFEVIFFELHGNVIFPFFSNAVALLLSLALCIQKRKAQDKRWFWRWLQMTGKQLWDEEGILTDVDGDEEDKATVVSPSSPTFISRHSAAASALPCTLYPHSYTPSLRAHGNKKAHCPSPEFLPPCCRADLLTPVPLPNRPPFFLLLPFPQQTPTPLPRWAPFPVNWPLGC